MLLSSLLSRGCNHNPTFFPEVHSLKRYSNVSICESSVFIACVKGHYGFEQFYEVLRDCLWCHKAAKGIRSPTSFLRFLFFFCFVLSFFSLCSDTRQKALHRKAHFSLWSNWIGLIEQVFIYTSTLIIILLSWDKFYMQASMSSSRHWCLHIEQPQAQHPPTSTHYYESTSPPEVWDLLVSDALWYHHREAQNHSPEHSRSPFLAGGIIFPPLSGMLDPCQSSSNNWKLISFGTTWLHPKLKKKQKNLYLFEQWLRLGITNTSSVWLPL